MKAFWITFSACLLAVMIMIGVVVYEKTYEFLYERSFIWIIISSFQSLISI